MTLPISFVTQSVNNTERRVVLWVGGTCPSVYFHVVDVVFFASKSSNILIPYLWGFPLIETQNNIRPRNVHIASSVVCCSTGV